MPSPTSRDELKACATYMLARLNEARRQANEAWQDYEKYKDALLQDIIEANYQANNIRKETERVCQDLRREQSRIKQLCRQERQACRQKLQQH